MLRHDPGPVHRSFRIPQAERAGLGGRPALAEAEATDGDFAQIEEPPRAKLKEDSIAQFRSVADLRA